MTASTASATDLINVLRRLVQILDEETKHLRAMDPAALRKVQQEKSVLTAAYDAMLTQLRAQPTLLQGLPAELREEVMQATGAFQRRLTENARALYAVKEANERLFKAVVQAVEDKHNETSTYAANGLLARATIASKQQPMSVAIDQHF